MQQMRMHRRPKTGSYCCASPLRGDCDAAVQRATMVLARRLGHQTLGSNDALNKRSRERIGACALRAVRHDLAERAEEWLTPVETAQSAQLTR